MLRFLAYRWSGQAQRVRFRVDGLRQIVVRGDGQPVMSVAIRRGVPCGTVAPVLERWLVWPDALDSER